MIYIFPDLQNTSDAVHTYSYRASPEKIETSARCFFRDPLAERLRVDVHAYAGEAWLYMRTIGQIVYVVDDEVIIAKSLAMILNREGFAASAFFDPREALAAAKNTSPDLLISDIKMPGMTGIELGIQFRRLYPDCRVLLFSGTASTSELLHNSSKDGFDFECLMKPVHPADLLAKIREALPMLRKEPSPEIPGNWLERYRRRG